MEHAFYASWADVPFEQQYSVHTLLQLAYGLATSSGALPTIGKVNYTMSRAGQPLMTVDFAAGTITGSITDYRIVGGVEWAFTDVTISADGKSFEGKLTKAGASVAEGLVEGFFVGPAGEEIIARSRFESIETLSNFFGKR